MQEYEFVFDPETGDFVKRPCSHHEPGEIKIIHEEIYDQQALEGLKQLNKYCEEYYGEILKKYEEHLHKRQKNL